jgi:hypothetical protein
MRCALCGRPTQPSVMLGQLAVGPKCARRAGLLAFAKRPGSQVRIAGATQRPAKVACPETMDLFEALT